MKSREANNIIANAKASLSIDGIKIPVAFETEGLRLLTSGYGYDGYVHAISGTKVAAAGTVFTRMIEIWADGKPASFDAELLSAIHKKLYGSLYQNAGRWRKTELTQRGSSFTDPRYIVGSLKSLLGKVETQKRLMPKPEFCSLLTHYYAELYLLAPFEQGNGIVNRTFLWLFARNKGFSLDYFKVPPRTFGEAERLAFTTDNVTELYNCLFSAVGYFNNTFDLPSESRMRPADKPRATVRPTKPVRHAPMRPITKPTPVKPTVATKPSPPPPPPVRETVDETFVETLKAQLKAELMEEIKSQLKAEAAATQDAKPDDSLDGFKPLYSVDPQAEPPRDDSLDGFKPLYSIDPQPKPPVAEEEQPQERRRGLFLLYAPTDRPPIEPIDDDPLLSLDAPPFQPTLSIDPPIERNINDRAARKRRERADKLKQKIAKLRQNLEDLLDE